MHPVTYAIAGAGLLCLAVVANAGDSRPQDSAQQPQFAERVEVLVGNVDVTVLGRDREPVEGLEREQFRLFVDGRPTEITHFAPCSSAAPTGAETQGVPSAEPGQTAVAESAVDGRRPRLLAILVDNENLSVFDRNRLLARLAPWLESRVRAPDRAVVFVNEKTLRVACPPTSDARAVARVVGEELGRSKATAAIHIEVKTTTSLIEGASIGARRSTMGFEQALEAARVHARRMREHTQRTVGRIRELVEMLAGVPARTDLLYLSDGLPMAPGIELYVLIDEMFNTGRAVMQYGQTCADLFAELAAAAQEAGVAIHTIDARGLIASSDADAEHAYERRTVPISRVDFEEIQNFQDPLLFLSKRTGGVAVVNTDDLEAGLATIGSSLDRCVSLGFALEPTDEDLTHAIRVELADARGTTLRYRPSLRQPSRTTRIADRTLVGLAFDPEENPLGVTVELGAPTKIARSRWRLPLRVTVPTERLALVARGEELLARLTVFIAARNSAGGISTVERETHEVVLPSEPSRCPPTVVITAEADVGEPPLRVSVGVLDEVAGQAGFTVATR